MAQKYEKIKLGLSAYITFALMFVALVVMIILIAPTKQKRLLSKYSGTYEVEKEGSQEKETKYYGLDKDHIIDTVSLRRLKKQINKDQYTYVIYGDTTNETFKQDVCKLNDIAVECGVNKLYVVDKADLNDDQKEYFRLMLREVNEDIKNVDKMPTFDIWCFKNKEMVNCYSKTEYSNLSIKMVAQYHIFKENK